MGFISSDSGFPTNHPLGMLGNLSALNMGVQSLQSFQHSDVLEKIKMQVRDMKVHGFLNPDFSSLHSSFSTTLQNSMGFNSQNLGQSQQTSTDPNGFPFSSTVPNKDGQIKNTITNKYIISLVIIPGSSSSTSSETSNSSQQNNGWSFEEQFKQVRQVSVITV